VRAVNLLPADTKQRKSFQGPGLLVIGMVVLSAVVVGALAMSYLSASSSVSTSQDDLASVRAQIAALPKGQQPPSLADQQLANDHSTRVQALNAALTGRVSWDRVLRQVDLVLPSDVWLTDLSGQAPDPPAPVATSTTGTTTTPAPVTPTPSSSGSCGAGSFCISGYTYSQESVARLLTRLETVPTLSDVQLVSSTSQVVGKQTVYQFHIQAELSTGGGA
jgi:Tfp pilus assembly protein PilN